jgi:hypothetical protein
LQEPALPADLILIQDKQHLLLAKHAQRESGGPFLAQKAKRKAALKNVRREQLRLAKDLLQQKEHAVVALSEKRQQARATKLYVLKEETF